MSQVKTDSITEHTSGAGVTLPVLLHAAAGINFGDQTVSKYAEGTYVPAVTLGSGSCTLNASFQTLQYTRVGRLVHVMGFLRVATVSSPTGLISVSLPFAPSAGVQLSMRGAVAVTVDGMLASWTGSPVGRISSTSGAIEVMEFSAGALNVGAAAKMQAGCDLYISATYEA